MNFNEYQKAALRTAQDLGSEELNVAHAGLGLGGEAGEVQEILKHIAFHNHPADSQKIASELGDVLWYAALIAELFGLNLEDVAVLNIGKLRRRHPNGYTHQGSLNRHA